MLHLMPTASVYVQEYYTRVSVIVSVWGLFGEVGLLVQSFIHVYCGKILLCCTLLAMNMLISSQ